MTHHTDAELLRDIEEHMRKMWDARLLPAVCWPADLAQRLTQAVRRAPAAPASEPELEAALNAMDKEVARMQPDRSVHWIGFTRDDRLRVVAAALAAAPQPPEAAPSSVSNGSWPEPVAYRMHDPEEPEIGHWLHEGRGMACLVHEPLYTEQQVRELLANHGIKVNQ